MPSLIPGFEYDIFISYRQKDNKGDRWVSEFVDALKTELESTFKEEISVYFDINPHDGLLETHDVDASLKEKLKCLVFIPIISRTYCDPKSFAWEHEFRAFVDIASNDQFGLKVKLPGGNVANRVLPVQIHDLEADDKMLVENELGGFIRGIEFIYKEPGVNKPLKPDDDEKKNLNRTKYEYQVNKVANAVREIITGIKNTGSSGKEISQKSNIEKLSKNLHRKTKIIAVCLLFLVLVVAGYFIFPKLIQSNDQSEKSIAVLPFKLISDQPDKQYLADGVMRAIHLNLQKFKDLRVMPTTSVEQYRGTTKTIHVIGRELNVEYLLEGSFQKVGDSVKLMVHLIEARKENDVWADEYNRNWKDIFSVQSEVSQTIGKELYTKISPLEKRLIEKIPTKNMTAWELYLDGKGDLKDYNMFRINSNQNVIDSITYQKVTSKFRAALEMDSTLAEAYAGLATAYYIRYYWKTYYNPEFLDSCLILANKALRFDPQLDEAYYIKGQYFRQNAQLDEALSNFDKALKINPNYFQAYYEAGRILASVKNDYVKGLDMAHKALDHSGGNERPDALLALGRIYLDIGFKEKAKKYFDEAFILVKDSSTFYRAWAYFEFSYGNFEEALNKVRKAEKSNPALLVDQYYYNVTTGHDEEAYSHAMKLISYFKNRGELDIRNSYRIGYAFLKMGNYIKAENFFNQQIKYSEESIKQNKYDAQTKQSQLSLAFTYAIKGDKEKAYQYLDELNTLNCYSKQRIILIKNDIIGSSIIKEDRFQMIIKNMEEKNEAEHVRVRKWLEENKML